MRLSAPGSVGGGGGGGSGRGAKVGTPQGGAFRRSARGGARAARGRGAARAGVGSAVRRGREGAGRTRRRRPDVGSRAVGHDVRARVRECARAAPSACPGAEAAGGRAAMSRWPVMIGSREKFAGVTTRQPWSIVSPEARPRRASLSPHAHARPPPTRRAFAHRARSASEDRRRTHASHARVTRAGVERRKQRSKETRGEMTDSQATEDVMQAQLCVAGCGFFGCVPRRARARARSCARRPPRARPRADPRARAAPPSPRGPSPFPRTRSDRPPPSPLARAKFVASPLAPFPRLRRAQEAATANMCSVCTSRTPVRNRPRPSRRRRPRPPGGDLVRLRRSSDARPGAEKPTRGPRGRRVGGGASPAPPEAPPRRLPRRPCRRTTGGASRATSASG